MPRIRLDARLPGNRCFADDEHQSLHYLVLPACGDRAGPAMLVVFGILVGWLGGAVVCSANYRIDLSSPRSSPP